MGTTRNCFSNFRPSQSKNQNTLVRTGQSRFLIQMFLKYPQLNIVGLRQILKLILLIKLKKPDKGYKETYVLNTTGKLKLNIAQNNSIYIEDIGDQKNKFILKDGRLVSFSTGKDADIFKIRYGNRGVPQSMYNVSKNTTEVEFVYNKEGFLYKIILSKDKKALFIIRHLRYLCHRWDNKTR